MSKLLVAASISASLALAACSSDTTEAAKDIIEQNTVSISGTVKDSSNADAALASADISCSYVNDSLPCANTQTDSNGKFSLTLLQNTDYSIKATKAGYITMNSAQMKASTNQTGMDFGLVTLGDAETMVQGLFGDSNLTMSSGAWLAVDVTDANGNSVNPTPTIGTSVSPAAIGNTSTSTEGPDYIARFSNEGSITVTVNGSSQTGKLITGEVLYIEFQQ